jgi:hypothetical protein
MSISDPLQRKMIGHGALILCVAMCAGVGLLMSAIGGIELIPGTITSFEIFGKTSGWVRTHVGGILNALLVFVVALILPGLGFAKPSARLVGNTLIWTGWANTLFYWAAMFAPNRALTFADNRLGGANLASVIGLAPALLFALLSLVTVAVIARQAFKGTTA